MGRLRCVVIGAGRLAGGFVAPVLRAAGWEVVLVSRNRAVVASANEGGGIWLRIVGHQGRERWIDGVSAVCLDDPRLPDLAARADLLATSVGPSALTEVGRRVAPLVRARLEASAAPINLITFENHRRAPELLALGLLKADPALGGQIGRRLGIAGAAVWRMVARRELTRAGLRFDADDVDECYVDAASLVAQAAPLNGSTPGIEPVRPFDCRMVEKLWIFNAGHAAAAYLGWQAGCATIDAAMGRPEIRAAVRSVLAEAQEATAACLLGRPGAVPIKPRSPDSILDRYAAPALADPVVRVGREPRRKLAAGDRLIGPAVACLGRGIRPAALASASAAALAYAEPSDPQAVDLQRELELLGPEEVLATVSALDPRDELSRLISASYRQAAVGPGRARSGVALEVGR